MFCVRIYQPRAFPNCRPLLSCRYGQTVRSDDSSTILAELVNSSGTTAAIVNPFDICTQGLSTLSSVTIDAKPGTVLALALSVPTLQDRVVPCTVAVALAMECPQGFVQQHDTRGNVVCVACGANYYENNGECNACVRGMECDEEGQSLGQVELKPGYWKTHALSSDIQKCRFGMLSCPGVGKRKNVTDGGRDMYCGPEYVGPLCSQCSSEYFMSWAQEGKCYPCAAGESYAPTIWLAAGVFVIGLVVFVGTAKTIQEKLPNFRAKVLKLYRLAKMKLFTLFVTGQVCHWSWRRVHARPNLDDARVDWCAFAAGHIAIFDRLEQRRWWLVSRTSGDLRRSVGLN